MKYVLALALGLTAPAAAFADEGRHFLFTGDGVAPGTGRIGLGVDALFVASGSDGGAIPVLSARYARGLSEMLDLRMSIATLGVYSDFDLGVGISLIRSPSFGLGLRAGVTGIVIISSGDDAVGGVFAGTPGVVATLRGDSVAFSIGADMPLYFNGFIASPSSAAAGTGFIPSVRPNFALELGGAGATFYIHGDATLFFTASDLAMLGHAGVGVHF